MVSYQHRPVMSDDEEQTAALLVLCSGALLLSSKLLNKKRKPRRWWRTALYKKRPGSELLADLKFQHISGQYKNFTRMSPTDFEYLLNKIGPSISKKETHFQQPISIQDRLAVTLRFLATGDSYTSLQYLFRISKQSIGRIIPEVCAALVEGMKENVKLPTTPMAWMDVVKMFEDAWNLPHCTGAIDGKHIVLQAPMNSGSDFFNYKSHFSIVLMAAVDANYNFIFVDVGSQGRISDGGVFKNTKLFKKIKENSLQLPPPKELPGRQIKVPYFFAADSAFALDENIMKPYSGDHARGSAKRIFNYRLSRARRVVENAFCIISAVFRVLRKPMLLQPEVAQLVVLTIIHLHNHLRKHSSLLYTPRTTFDYEEAGVLTPGSWRNDQNMTSMISLRNIPRRSTVYLQEIRNELADYCVKEGAVPWQNQQ